MSLNLRRAKRIATASLITSSCAFFLLVSQNNIHADTGNQTVPTMQTTQTTQQAVNNNQQTNSQVNVNDEGNYAWLDNVAVQQNGGGQTALTVNGWHATNQAINRPSHYIILLDRTTNQEIGRQRIQPVARPDVARVHTDVENAGQSGFSATFNLTNRMNFNDQLQVVSRYTSSNDGNSNYVDYWFPVNETSFSHDNYANLDRVDYSSGHLQVAGWNANDFSAFAPNHFLILYDRTTNRQLASVKVPVITRNDVKQVYPQFITGAQSGFSTDFGAQNLEPDHDYAVVSRYSTSANGNGGDGQYQDNWMEIGRLNQTASHLDSLTQNGHSLHLSGWMASSQRINKPYAYLIVLNDGREIGRARVNFVARPDVARVYPQIYDSLNSGFNQDVPINVDQATGQLSVIMRFTDDAAGNGNYVDQRSNNFVTNAGWLDQFQVNGGTLNVSGWHAASATADKPVHLLIILGPDGSELYRTQLNDNNTGLSRNDVANAYPWIGNASQSGFSASIPVNFSMNDANIRIISRYATSIADDNNAADYVDYYFSPRYLHANIADHWVSTNNGEYFVHNGQNLTGSQMISGVHYNFDQSGREIGFAQRVIDWFRSREGRLTYSMYGSRTGADGTADCSGSVTQAIQDAGGSRYWSVFNTDTLGPYLQQNGYYVASAGWQNQPVQYGDIVIWGVPGHSVGGAGHVVVVSTHGDNPSCISTQWFVTHGTPGTAVYEGPYTDLWNLHGRMYATVYRMSNPGRN